MIALHILIQARADPAAIVTAVPGEVPGVAGTASVAGPSDVIALPGTRDTGWYGEDARDKRGVFGMAQGREQLQRHGGDHARPPITAAQQRVPRSGTPYGSTPDQQEWSGWIDSAWQQ